MPDRTLRVVSYNVRYFGHALKGLASTVGPKQRIATALLTLEPLPDLICLQEVETISLRSRMAHRANHGEETQLEAFMRRLEASLEQLGRANPYEAYYFRAHAYRLGSTPLYTTGLAILVNRERLSVNEHNVDTPHHITHHHLKRMKARKQSRICAHLKVGFGQRTLHVFNTHLSLPTPFAKAFWSNKQKMGFGANQLVEARKLLAFVSELARNEPLVLCGDFNSAPWSPVYQELVDAGQLVAAQASLGLIDPTKPAAFASAGFLRLRMHLDHLFSRGLTWLDMDGTAPFGDLSGRFHGMSDHIPLVGRFRVG